MTSKSQDLSVDLPGTVSSILIVAKLAEGVDRFELVISLNDELAVLSHSPV